MKLDIRTIDLDDGRCCFLIIVDGEKVFDVGDGEPEDNTLGRNFNDCFGIPDLLQKAYNAGKSGEQLEITRSDKDPDSE